jgi:hypothetical protein
MMTTDNRLGSARRGGVGSPARAVDEPIDYATRAVRDNPDMQKWFEDKFQVSWKDGGTQTKLVFALGFAAALLHQRGEKPGSIEE